MISITCRECGCRLPLTPQNNPRSFEEPSVLNNTQIPKTGRGRTRNVVCPGCGRILIKGKKQKGNF